jgi:hypothetical protein
MQAAAAADAPVASLQPVHYATEQPVDAAFCQQLQAALHQATWAGVAATAQVLPADVLSALVQRATRAFAKEPTLVEVS